MPQCMCQKYGADKLRTEQALQECKSILDRVKTLPEVQDRANKEQVRKGSLYPEI